MESEIYHSEMDELWQSAMEQDLFHGNLVIEIGRFFIDAPYKSGTLEALRKEKLLVNFAEFDCTTFVETVLALALCAASGKLSSSEFRKNLTFIRYRQGKIDGYSSRLHYFTDWLRDNEKKQVLRDVSRRMKGKPKRNKINFMTTHRELYAALKSETECEKMRQVEQNISRKTFYVIDKNDIGAKKTEIQNGDIIAFATNQEGLDVAHAGFAVWQGKNLHLLHASSTEGGVAISKKTLVAYLRQNKKFSGIIIARL